MFDLLLIKYKTRISFNKFDFFLFFISKHTCHFRHLKQEKDAEKCIKELEKGPKLDLGFKEGQTIRINISVSSAFVAYTLLLGFCVTYYNNVEMFQSLQG